MEGEDMRYATPHMAACKEICLRGVESLLLSHMCNNDILDIMHKCTWYALVQDLQTPMTTLQLVEMLVLLCPVV